MNLLLQIPRLETFEGLPWAVLYNPVNLHLALLSVFLYHQVRAVALKSPRPSDKSSPYALLVIASIAMRFSTIFVYLAIAVGLAIAGPLADRDAGPSLKDTGNSTQPNPEDPNGQK